MSRPNDAPEWIWYGEDDNGHPIVTFGRWPKRGAKWLYVWTDRQIVPCVIDVSPPLNLERDPDFENRGLGIIAVSAFCGGVIGAAIVLIFLFL